MAALAADSSRSGAELRALILLRLLPGMALPRMSDVLEVYGSATSALASRGALEPHAAAAARDPSLREWAERGAAEVERNGDVVLAAGDAAYPERLRHLKEPPPLLFLRGRTELLDATGVGVVGTRRATAEGKEAAAAIGAAVLAAGGVVVSGLALGIDGAAHRAAMPATIGVLACGVDVPYPRRHAALQREMARDALLVSEFPPGTPPLTHHFPQRNRIIAALSEVVAVVEAPEKSGALSTARHALDLGRDILAMPGPPRRDVSKGTNRLIRDGAAMLLDPIEVVEAAGLVGARAAVTETLRLDGLGPAPVALFQSTGGEPRTLDDIAARGAVEAGAAQAALLELELRGLVRRLPGSRYVRV